MEKSTDLNGNCHGAKSANRSSRYLQFKKNLSNSQVTSPNSANDTSQKSRHLYCRSPIRSIHSPTSTAYDPAICNRRETRSAPSTIVQDIVQMKIMLIKLRRILSKEEDKLFLEGDCLPKNGVSDTKSINGGSYTILPSENKLEDGICKSADLEEQIAFMRRQLEERDETILVLQEKIEQLKIENLKYKTRTVNSTTQTEKNRPISAGPLLLQEFTSEDVLNYSNSNLSFDGIEGAPTLRLHNNLRKSLPRLWRRSAEPASLQVLPNKGTTSYIPRRAKSHSRSTAV